MSRCRATDPRGRERTLREVLKVILSVNRSTAAYVRFKSGHGNHTTFTSYWTRPARSTSRNKDRAHL